MMTFNGFKAVIELGDLVVLYLGINNMHALEVRPQIKNKKDEMVENVLQTTYGALKVKSLIGKDFGSKVELSRGWAYALHPTPELWTLTLPHRTQIIYTPDISLILLQLEVVPGSVVVESGTGSGSLTHALARCVQPRGHVHTFDFHAQRAAMARREVEAHGVAAVVSVGERDVCEQGFGDAVAGRADAVFLDLPHPWLAVRHAASALKRSGGRLVSFSPCIEQVQRTHEALLTCGFVELETSECVQRELQVRSRTVAMASLGSRPSPDCEPETRRFLTALPPPSTPGHSGYLTAASLPPRGPQRS